MPDVFPHSAEEFAVWLGTLNTVVSGNLAGFGVVAGDLANTTAAKTDIDGKIVSNDLAQEAAKGTTAGLNTGLTTGKTAARALVRLINGKGVATPALIEAAGLKVRDTVPTPIVPVAPSGLVVVGRPEGTNALSWSANGNVGGTTYLIEGMIGASATWVLIDVTTKTKFNHIGQTPGVNATYRVKARRRDQTSAPSNTAVVYP